MMLPLAAALAGPIDLSALYNVDALEVSPPPVAGLSFAAGGNDGAGIRSTSHPKLPPNLTAPVGGSFDWLVIAWTVLGDSRNGEVVGTLSVDYADGKTHQERIVLGREVTAQDNPLTGPAATPIALGPGKAISVYQLANPYPGSPPKQIRLAGRNAASSLVLLAASTVNGPPPLPVPAVRPVVPGGFVFHLDPAVARFPQPDATRIGGPAGAKGFVEERDGHLWFPDGERARFWGVNLLSEMCAPPEDASPVLARSLAEAGINLVRLHHCDGDRAGIVNPARTGPADLFDPVQLRKFDKLVASLIAEGIYVFLEVATNRVLTAADGAEGSTDGVPNGHKLLPMFEPSWGRAYEDWTRAWLGRTNPFTARSYADEPGVAIVELGNEHSLVAGWFAADLEAIGADHRASLDRRWNEWLRGRYADAAAVEKAWTGSVHPGIQPGEKWGELRREPSTRAVLGAWPDARGADLHAFYFELEADFFRHLGRVVRELGYRVPLVPGISFERPELAMLGKEFGIADHHLAWNNQAAKGDVEPRSMLSSPREAKLLLRLGVATFGKPFMISELSHQYPSPYAAEAPLFWSTMASLQDWDALIWLNYANARWIDQPRGVSVSSELRTNSVQWGQFAMASALFRSGAVLPAAGLWVQHRDTSVVVDDALDPMGGTYPQQRDTAFAIAHRMRRSYGEEVPAPVAAPADAGQVGWWVEAGLLVVDTPGAQAVIGRHDLAAYAGRGEGGGPARASRVDARLDGFAAVSFASLDGKPLEASRRALLTVAGRMEHTGMRTDPGETTALTWDAGDMMLHVPRGTVRFRWSGKPTVVPLGPDGKAGAPLGVEKRDGGWWEFTPGGETMWWQVS